MATTTPKELTKSTYITFKPAYKDCNLSPIDLARIAASADGYTVRKNEEGTGWDMCASSPTKASPSQPL